MISLAVLITSHNRKEKTVSSLQTLNNCILPQNTSRTVYLVDDGSTDGTSDEVTKHFPDVHIINGDGNLFWSRGMHLAFDMASKKEYDFYLWLNDDTMLYNYALITLIATWQTLPCSKKASIIVGSTSDPEDTTNTTYGGLIKTKGIHPFHFKILEPTNTIQYADTMSGNIVMIPKTVFKRVGIVDKAYCHGLGDFDYGLRARKKGCSIIVPPGFLGSCRRNDIALSWENVSLPLKTRLMKVFSKKGLPFKSWFIFSYRHGGILWPLWAVTPYLRVLLKKKAQCQLSVFTKSEHQCNHDMSL